jgi:Ca2+-binding EF-hand superfamily protein
MVILRDMVVRGQVLKLRKATLMSLDAFQAGVDSLFGNIDLDADGSINQTELMEELFAQRGESASRAEARRVRRSADGNKDRKVSKSEWLSVFADSAKQWDVNSDGKLSTAELKSK